MSNKTFTRKQLYDLVWSKPLTKLAKEYAISDNGLRKICKKHNIPLPKLGHWQKLQYGKKVNIIPLPKLENKDIQIELSVRKEGKNDDYSYLSEYHRLKKEIENDESLNLVVPDRISKSHSLVSNARKDLSRKAPSEWGNSQGLVSSSSNVLNIEVSKSSIPRVLRFMNCLIKLLMQRKHSIIVDGGKTYAIVNGEKLELRCRETLKRVANTENRWQSYDYYPSGRLKLMLENIYPNKEWKDGSQRKLEDQLPNILTTLELKSKEIKKERAKREEWKRQYEIQRKKEEELKELKGKELKNFKILYRSSDLLHKANVMRDYINTVKEQALKKGNLNDKLNEWINWANKKADWIDPLTDIDEDELLGIFDEKYLNEEKTKHSWWH
ncbi:MAG: hypothetical protein DSY77_01780 [Bacteroidetes bacterium]|nr:MAG: hypothetical protein DSY77_01780 [Bacteroidota bacterium]